MQAFSRIGVGMSGVASLVLLAAGGAPAVAGNPVNTGLFGGVAIMGYDTVAYFTEGRPMKGSEEFSYDWLGTPWLFASEKHRQLFISEPTRYAPQFGGYCTSGIALDGHAAENIDPERAWRIIDGKLYLVYDPTYVEDLDGPAREEILANAEAHWPETKAKIEQQGFN